MNVPLVYQLFCQGHRWVATYGCDKSWKHLSSKPTLRWTFPEVPSKTSWLIGWMCNGCKPFSWPVLIERLAYFNNSLVYYLIKYMFLYLIYIVFSVTLKKCQFFENRSFLAQIAEYLWKENLKKKLQETVRDLKIDIKKLRTSPFKLLIHLF